jgi:hypothetical protein
MLSGNYFTSIAIALLSPFFSSFVAASLQPPIFLYCFLLMFCCCGSQVLCYAVKENRCHYVSYGLGVQTLLCVVESNGNEWHEDFCLHSMGIQCVEGESKMEFRNNK